MSKLKRKLKSVAASNVLLWKTVKRSQEIQYDINYHRFYGMFSTARASITEFNLEFSSSCNLRCKFCALDHLKPRQYMSVKVIDEVFQTLLTDVRFARVKTINLHNGGETLMHPTRMELFHRLRYFKDIFKAKGRKFPKLVLLTNGMLLRERLSKELLDLKVLDEIGFSLDGGSPEAFEEMRVNARWEKFARNVEDLVKLKNEIDPGLKTFGITIVPHPLPLNDSWMEADFQRIARLLDSIEYRRLHDWGGQIDIDGGRAVNKKGCSLLMRQLVILPSGEVTVCCNDLNGKGIVGNILNSNLYSIYAGKGRMEYIDLLKKGRKNELDLCKECVSF